MENSSINMEFVENDNDEQNEQNVPAPKESTNPPDEKKEEKKPSIIRRAWNTVTFPVRWCGRKLKESPAAGAIGMVLGGAATLGGKVLYDHLTGGRGGSGGQDECVPADNPEIEIPDYGESYIDPVDTTETYNTEE